MPSLNRPARLNRSLLALAGLALLAAGGFALASHFGWLTLLARDSAVVPGTALPPTWGLYVAAAAGIVVALLGLRWLLAQLARKPKTSVWRFDTDPAHGRTELVTTTAIEPLLAEIRAYPGVSSARGALAGGREAAKLALTITVDRDGDPSAIRGRLEDEGLPRFRGAVELDELPTTAEFRFSPKAGSRIR